jgi:hypothetical protein
MALWFFLSKSEMPNDKLTRNSNCENENVDIANLPILTYTCNLATTYVHITCKGPLTYAMGSQERADEFNILSNYFDILSFDIGDFGIKSQHRLQHCMLRRNFWNFADGHSRQLNRNAFLCIGLFWPYTEILELEQVCWHRSCIYLCGNNTL